MINITDVKIKIITYQVRVRAVATIEIDNCFVVNDIKIVESLDGLFIMMPNRRTPDGEIKDIAHPINKETRELIQSTILKKYEELERK
jgi:stage V sporulation protein G